MPHRLRKEWFRTQDGNGKWQWSRNFDCMTSTFDSISSSAAFTFIRSSSSLESLATLQICDANEVDASQTLTNYPINTHVLQSLVEFSAQDFSSKYAWFLKQTDTMKQSRQIKAMLTINRDELFQNSLLLLQDMYPEEFCSPMEMKIDGEDAIDAGGVQREWYMIFTQTLFESDNGLFVMTSEGTQEYYFNPNSLHDFGPDHVTAFRSVGRFLARALLDGQTIPANFCSAFYKLLLGLPMSLDDMNFFDHTVYKCMVHIRDNESIDNLALTFSVTEPSGPEIAIVDLIPGGRNIDVTNANKHIYLDYLTRHLLLQRVSVQYEHLIQGFYEVL